MAEFLTTSGIAHRLEEIVTDAKARLILISPYLKISTILMERLREADKRGLEITIVYGKDELQTEQKKQLMRLEKLQLYYLDNLHAKCYMNESAVIVTSMNMYDFSEKKNREMGIMLASSEPAYLKAKEEVNSIIAAARRERLAVPAAASSTPAAATSRVASAQHRPRSRQAASDTASKTGVCIRCLGEISRNSARPLCRACYERWAMYNNPDYPEKGCHYCGRAGDVSLARPLCRSCYREAQPAH